RAAQQRLRVWTPARRARDATHAIASYETGLSSTPTNLIVRTRGPLWIGAAFLPVTPSASVDVGQHGTASTAWLRPGSATVWQGRNHGQSSGVTLWLARWSWCRVGIDPW